MRPRPARAVILGLGVLLGACAPKRVACPVPSPAATPGADTVQVTFLGVGGFVVRWSGAAIMTAPLYSNPSVGEIALSEIHADRARIDALLPDVGDVRAILSGHAHYDHLMDVPYVARHKATRADLIGNDAMRKLLAPIAGELASRTPPNRLVSLQGSDPCAPAGHEVSGTRFRIRAIASEHSPQIGPGLLKGLLDIPPVSLWRGEPEDALEVLPNRVGEWPSGSVLAFVIDLLERDSDKVAFRIYYQDSPTRRPLGYPPDCLGTRPIDLAILCLGGATEFEAFPADIVEYLQPRYVLGSHWEDFFSPRDPPLPDARRTAEELRLIPGVKPGRFLRAVSRAQPVGGQASVPCPDTVTTFVKSTSGWALAPGSGAWTMPKR